MKRQNKAAGYEARECQNCGKKFTPLFPHQWLDTPECRKEWDREYIRKYQQQSREQMRKALEDSTPL